MEGLARHSAMLPNVEVCDQGALRAITYARIVLLAAQINGA